MWAVRGHSTKAAVPRFQTHVHPLITEHYWFFILNAMRGMGKKNGTLQLLLRAPWPEVTSGEPLRKHFKELEEDGLSVIRQQEAVSCVKLRCICVLVLSLLSNGAHRRISFGGGRSQTQAKANRRQKAWGIARELHAYVPRDARTSLLLKESSHLKNTLSHSSLLCLVQLISHCLSYLSTYNSFSSLPVNNSLMPRTLEVPLLPTESSSRV